MADELVKLIDPNGVEVQVSAEKVARLIGYTEAEREPEPRRASAK